MRIKGAFLAAILAVVPCFSGNVFAALSGDGTEANPYLIQSRADFDEYGDPDNAASYWASGVYTKLMCNLDLAGTIYTQAPIAPYYSTKFTGAFDGNSHTISNLTINQPTENQLTAGVIGLFGYVDSSGQIKNLRVETVDISVSDEGATAGSLVGSNKGTLISCYASGSVVGTRLAAMGYIGGLVGSNNSTGAITFCYATCLVSGGSLGVGGLAGNNSGTLADCYATGSVSGTGQSVGGLAGESGGTISACYATGSVNGRANGYIGGLLGQNGGTLTSCHATGSVTGGSSVGGLVGHNLHGTHISCCYATGLVTGTGQGVGGLVGRTEYGVEISNCYATSSVGGTSNVGGLVGLAGFDVEISNCNATGSVTGTGNAVGGLVGMTDFSVEISKCYATGSVSGGSFVGGLVGLGSATLTSCYAMGSVTGTGHGVGGLLGYNDSSNSVISNCYATGSVGGTSDVGGLVGCTVEYFTITACFWDEQTSGQTVGVGNSDAYPDSIYPPFGVTGKTTAQMKTLSTFTSAGWDFSTADGDAADWMMPPGDYPKLSWQYRIGLDGFNLLSQYWQMSGCTAGQPCALADWYVDGTIDLLDLEVLAEYWLSNSITKLYPSVYWPMDESAGSSMVADILNGYNGQLINMDPDTCWTTGHIGGALQFDGVDDYVSVTGHKGILGTSSRTCAAWIKTPGTAQNMVILGWGGQQWVFGLFGSGELTVYAGGPYIKTTGLVNDNQWHHVAAVMTDDGSPNVSEITLYVDGILQTTVKSPGVINTPQANDVLIGAFSAGTPAGFFKGLIDDVRIYGKALSGAQIEEIFQTE